MSKPRFRRPQPKTDRILAILDLKNPQKASVIANLAGCTEPLVYQVALRNKLEDAIEWEYDDGKITIQFSKNGDGKIYLKKSVVRLLHSIGIIRSGQYVFGSRGGSKTEPPTMMVILSPGDGK